jgi:hypothetical protein
MNQRIRAMAEQAGLTYVLQPCNPHIESDLAKFARLIVADCAAELEFQRESYANPGTYESHDYYERMEAKESAMAEAIDIIEYRYRDLNEAE